MARFALGCLMVGLMATWYAWAVTYQPADSRPGCIYMATPVSMHDGQLQALRCDINGALLTTTTP